MIDKKMAFFEIDRQTLTSLRVKEYLFIASFLPFGVVTNKPRAR